MLYLHYGFHDNILYLDVINCGLTSLKVFHENILCAISSGDVTYDLFLYLSGFNLLVKTKVTTSIDCLCLLLENTNNKHIQSGVLQSD